MEPAFAKWNLVFKKDSNHEEQMNTILRAIPSYEQGVTIDLLVNLSETKLKKKIVNRLKDHIQCLRIVASKTDLFLMNKSFRCPKLKTLEVNLTRENNSLDNDMGIGPYFDTSESSDIRCLAIIQDLLEKHKRVLKHVLLKNVDNFEFDPRHQLNIESLSLHSCHGTTLEAIISATNFGTFKQLKMMGCYINPEDYPPRFPAGTEKLHYGHDFGTSDLLEELLRQCTSLKTLSVVCPIDTLLIEEPCNNLEELKFACMYLNLESVMFTCYRAPRLTRLDLSEVFEVEVLEDDIFNHLKLHQVEELLLGRMSPKLGYSILKLLCQEKVKRLMLKSASKEFEEFYFPNLEHLSIRLNSPETVTFLERHASKIISLEVEVENAVPHKVIRCPEVRMFCGTHYKKEDVAVDIEWEMPKLKDFCTGSGYKLTANTWASLQLVTVLCPAEFPWSKLSNQTVFFNRRAAKLDLKELEDLTSGEFRVDAGLRLVRDRQLLRDCLFTRFREKPTWYPQHIQDLHIRALGLRAKGERFRGPVMITQSIDWVI